MELHEARRQHAAAVAEVAGLKARAEEADTRAAGVASAMRSEVAGAREGQGQAVKASLDKSKRLRDLAAQLHAARQELDTCPPPPTPSRDSKTFTRRPPPPHTCLTAPPTSSTCGQQAACVTKRHVLLELLHRHAV